MKPNEKFIQLLAKISKAGCVAEPEVMEYSAKKICILCCREVIQELAIGKINSVSIQQELDYHNRLLYWNDVLSIVEKEDTWKPKATPINSVVCPECEGKKELVYSCCTGEPVDNDLMICPTCKEHLGEEPCFTCGGTGIQYV